MARRTRKRPKSVETLVHDEAARRNIPTAEYHPVLSEEDKAPVRVAYERRNRDLDPQLVWRGKDEQDLSDLAVQAPPLYIQEKVHPKALIDDLLRQTKERRDEEADETPDLFADFNGLPDGRRAGPSSTSHDANWSNRMILGDALQVMASLAEREGLRGKVQCIYIDPPYGIKLQLQLPVVHHQPRREGRQRRPHHPRARASEGVPRHLARRHPFLPELSAQSSDSRHEIYWQRAAPFFVQIGDEERITWRTGSD